MSTPQRIQYVRNQIEELAEIIDNIEIEESPNAIVARNLKDALINRHMPVQAANNIVTLMKIKVSAEMVEDDHSDDLEFIVGVFANLIIRTSRYYSTEFGINLSHSDAATVAFIKDNVELVLDV